VAAHDLGQRGRFVGLAMLRQPVEPHKAARVRREQSLGRLRPYRRRKRNQNDRSQKSLLHANLPTWHLGRSSIRPKGNGELRTGTSASQDVVEESEELACGYRVVARFFKACIPRTRRLSPTA